MRVSIAMFVLCGLIAAASPALAQRGADSDRPTTASGADGFVANLMKFDKNDDGKLTKNEITDERLLPLFERADADHDGVVTADELKALYAKEGASFGRRGRRRPEDSFANADDPRGQRRGQPAQVQIGPVQMVPALATRMVRVKALVPVPGSVLVARAVQRSTAARPNPSRPSARDAETHRRSKEATRRLAERGGREALENPYG